MAMIVGVLGIQGAYTRHVEMLARLGNVPPRTVRFADEFDDLDALIIPGGESTTFTILLERWGLRDRIIAFLNSGRPIWGTCAGAVVLCSRILDRNKEVDIKPLCAVDVAVERNGFGRQVDSFEADVKIELAPGGSAIFNGVFIRAPRFSELGKAVKVLGWLGQEPVMIEHGNALLTSFHPELTDDTTIHRYFVGKLADAKEEVV